MTTVEDELLRKVNLINRRLRKFLIFAICITAPIGASEIAHHLAFGDDWNWIVAVLVVFLLGSYIAWDFDR